MARARWSVPRECANVDADTLRRRALDDRRGSLYADVYVPTELGRTLFTLRWSVRGRTDQVDVMCEGAILATIRPGRALEMIYEAACAGALNTNLTRTRSLRNSVAT